MDGACGALAVEPGERMRLPRRRARLLLSILVVSTAFLLPIVLGRDPPPAARATGPLASEAYIWQRHWSPAVASSARSHGPQFTRLAVLAAEVSFDGGRPIIHRVAIDHAALRDGAVPIALTVRIGSYTGPFTADSPLTRQLPDLCAALLADARLARLNVRELQLDFDCPESRLAAYRVWLQGIRRAIAPTPLTITALPSWLDDTEFAALARSCDGFVLQVHSLRRPRSTDDLTPLCHPAAARRAVEDAAGAGVAFRVALPTHTYLCAFDSGGRYLGAAAEGLLPDWPADASIVELRADAEAMASLVRAWTQDRPALMQGLIWYRLPVPGDRLNWSWPTLAGVMSGRNPMPRLRVEVRRPDDGLVEADLVNEGDADALMPDVELKWSAGGPIASDTLAGYAAELSPRRMLLVRPRASSPPLRLAPSARRTIAWLRFESRTEVNAHVSAR